jgi:DNA-binding transcriptional regulator YiaG
MHYHAMTGSEVTKIREKLKLTPQGLADVLDVHRITVQRWEAGRPIPRTVEIALRAMATGKVAA